MVKHEPQTSLDGKILSNNPNPRNIHSTKDKESQKRFTSEKPAAENLDILLFKKQLITYQNSSVYKLVD